MKRSTGSGGLVGITMGCPVGIGPEIITRFLSAASDFGPYRPVVLGDLEILRRCARELGIGTTIAGWRPGLEVERGAINVFNLSSLPLDLAWGRPNRETGRAMARYIEEAVALQRQGVLAAMVTCPISKEFLHEAGYPFPGHTEMLASLCGTDDYAMMLAAEGFRVTLVTIHARLADVPLHITRAAVSRLIDMTGRSLRLDFGVADPCIGVAGLNPHAGENGLFGDEEMREIGPAVEDARAYGWRVDGPLPPDTVFHKMASGRFDAVVCMYHDQGLIPFKLLHFADGVNVTLGLPIVRTSVDHGTAYDIAGTGSADPASLGCAFKMAVDIAINREKADGASRKSGLLIAFEGIDGTGKTTQIRLLADELLKEGYDVVLTREPTDGEYGRRIRELYIDRRKVSGEDELGLFMADRRQHVDEVIAPALAQGKIVLTDRYYLSTAAYQGAIGHDPEAILRLNEKFAPSPDLAFLLDISPAMGIERIKTLRRESLNAFEQIDDLRKVAAVYEGLSRDYIKRLDAAQSVVKVHEEVMLHVRPLLARGLSCNKS